MTEPTRSEWRDWAAGIEPLFDPTDELLRDIYQDLLMRGTATYTFWWEKP